MDVRRTLHALQRPLTRAEARSVIAGLPEYRETHKVRIRDLTGGARIVAVILTGITWVAVALITAALAIGLVALVRDTVTQPRTTLPFLIIMLSVVIALGVAVIIERRRAPQRRARLVLLSAENDWDFEPLAYPPNGALFAFGDERTVHDRIRLQRNPRVEIAEYSCRVDNGKSTTRVRYAYLAIALPQHLPHIALDSLTTTGRRRSPLALAAGFAQDQHLALEGDFDTHFRLFAPTGYEQDALYLFTPDIMALFIDHAGSFDVEIIDGWLYLYGLPRTLTEPTVERWEANFALIDALERKLDQWSRWRDGSKKRYAPRGTPRTLAQPKPGVAQAGERLRPVRVFDRLRRASVLVGALILIFGITAAVVLPLLGY